MTESFRYFVRVLFSQNFASVKFCKNKGLTKIYELTVSKRGLIFQVHYLQADHLHDMSGFKVSQHSSSAVILISSLSIG